MKSTSTVRSFNGVIYVRIPPGYEEYFNLKKFIDRAKQTGDNLECKIEDTSENQLLVTFPKWS